jgi:hypothetical protein
MQVYKLEVLEDGVVDLEADDEFIRFLVQKGLETILREAMEEEEKDGL